MSSSDPQPRFGQSVKGLLSDKVGSCSGDVIALTRQVLKGSRSQEVKRHAPSSLRDHVTVMKHQIRSCYLELNIQNQSSDRKRTNSLHLLRARRVQPEPLATELAHTRPAGLFLGQVFTPTWLDRDTTGKPLVSGVTSCLII